jgi:hypothetical protein
MLAAHDPRDMPGTDDHILLVHPHGDAVIGVGLYFTDDPQSYVRAALQAHEAISDGYLNLPEMETLPPLCGEAHVEILRRGIDELPHSLRDTHRTVLEEAEAMTGRPVGLLRVWRHVGLDCEAAEANRSCQPV